MSLFGVHLTLLIGPTLPIPAPPLLLEAIDQVEVTHSDEERSGFQIVFRAGRSERDILDYPLVDSPLLVPGSRAILVVTVGVVPTVLFDGLITQQQLSPAQRPGDSILTVTGEDVTFAMDRAERSVEHVGLNEAAIAFVIITSYARFGLVPVIIPPPSIDVPLPIERVPVQQETDLAYLNELATRYDYVFTVTPGPAPGFNQAYWGPPPRLGVPQPALSVGMGPDTNVRGRPDIQHNAGEVTRVAGVVQDRLTNQAFPVQSLVSLRPPFATRPALENATAARTAAYRAQGARSIAQAMAEAQAQQDRSTDVVQVEGELDSSRYGRLLQARALVGLRGVGRSYDGLYYVRRVTHTLVPSGITREASFTTKFSLLREGLGATVPAVLPS